MNEEKYTDHSLPLFIPLKTEYYQAFATGRKRVEYRRYGKRWNEKTCTIGRAVTLSKGYGKQNRLSGIITGFDVRPLLLLEGDIRSELESLFGAGDTDIACISIGVSGQK